MSKPVSFNYKTISNAKVAKQAQDAARKIKDLLGQNSVSMIEIGKQMTAVKAVTSPKQFAAWVEAEFGWVQSVAVNYMMAAKTFGDLDCVRQFRTSSLFTLSRKNVPESVIKECIKRARAGETIMPAFVTRLLKDSGVSASRPDAGVARKPRSVQQVGKFVDSISQTIDSMTLSISERETLAAKFFELAMRLRMPVTPPAPTPVAAPTASSARGKQPTTRRATAKGKA